MTLTLEQKAELKNAAEKATPGPWKAFNMTDHEGRTLTAEEIGLYVKNSILKSIEDGGAEDRFLFISQSDCGCPDICHVGNGPTGPWNATFIAAANPAAILALLAENAKLREENAELTAKLGAVRPRQFVEVAADDWEGLYVDHKLFTEGHSISVHDLVRASAGRPFTHEIRRIRQSWMEDQGTLPDDLSAIPITALETKP